MPPVDPESSELDSTTQPEETASNEPAAEESLAQGAGAAGEIGFEGPVDPR